MRKNFLLLLGLIFIALLLIFDSTILCEGDSDKFTESIKQVGEKIEPVISGNNVNNNIDNPSIHLHNSEINFHGLGQVGTSFGIGATAAAGMRAMTYRSNSLPPATRAVALGAGGLAGATIFIGGNILNSYAQNRVTRDNSDNGPFSSSSIIEEGDSVELIMNFLYFNLFIAMFILLLGILLVYLFKKDKSKLIIITIIFLEIFSYISYYLALNLYDDIGIISVIYQNSIDYSTVIANSNLDGVEMAKGFLNANILISLVRLVMVFLFPGMYLNYKVIHGNWNISFLKRIFGERFYYYFMKIYSYGSKTSLGWIYYSLIILIIACLTSIVFGYFLIIYLDTITELYLKSNK